MGMSHVLPPNEWVFLSTINQSYLAPISWVGNHFVFHTPKCPRCHNDESMLLAVSMVETVSKNETLYFRVFTCQDCGKDAAIGYRQVTVNMDTPTVGM